MTLESRKIGTKTWDLHEKHEDMPSDYFFILFLIVFWNVILTTISDEQVRYHQATDDCWNFIGRSKMKTWRMCCGVRVPPVTQKQLRNCCLKMHACRNFIRRQKRTLENVLSGTGVPPALLKWKFDDYDVWSSLLRKFPRGTLTAETSSPL